MEDNNPKALSLSINQNSWNLIPEEDINNQNYLLHRINLESIKINEKIRDYILRVMNEGKKFVQIGNHTVMVNSIQGIDPIKMNKIEEPLLEQISEEERTKNIERIKKLKETLLK
jgi:type II secretory pathway component PulC